VDEFGRSPAAGDERGKYARSLRYAPFDASDATALAEALARSREEIGGEPRLLHYLSVPPQAMAGIVGALGAAGPVANARVIMEKPFGTDLASARALNAVVHSVFDESQIFRIDHFLGKESVQNILALRFANGLFEPVWNRDHIDSVQIDVPETLSIGDRAGFYEGTGAFRDMVVTHLFQVLGFVAMEPPTSLDPDGLVAEKAKVFQAMKPLDPTRAVRGQYQGTWRRRALPPSPRPRPSSPTRSRSRTGAGPASPSSSGRASGSPRADA
jgi:glucose-6-phosphate 1-dehydrogenase